MSSDEELLQRACAVDDFFGSAFFEDKLDDWSLARDFGEFMLRIEEPVIGHALLARAHRHLGNSQRAHDELECLRRSIANEELTQGEIDMFARLLGEEEKFLRIKAD